MSTQDQSSEEIERSIEGTRTRIDAGLDSLQEKFSPTQAASHAYRFARDNGANIASGIGRTVRENPMPVILTAAGVTWLLLSSRKKSPQANHNTNGVASGHGADQGIAAAAGEKVSNLGAGARDAAGAVRDKAADYAGTVREKGGQVASAAGTFAEEHPLAVGAIGLALGAVIGAALAPTAREDRILGATADEAKTAIKDAAREKAEHAKEVAAAAAEEGVQRAREEAEKKGLTPEALKRSNETTKSATSNKSA